MLRFFKLSIPFVAFLSLSAAAAAQPSTIRFEDSDFDTTSSDSAWQLAGLGSDDGLPSCLLVPTPDPEAQGRSNDNVCQGSDGDSSDGDGRALFGDFDVFDSPFEGLLGVYPAGELGYDPVADGAIEAVRVRFQLKHGWNNSGTPVNNLGARALIFQRGPSGEARFFASLDHARIKSRSNATDFTLFDRMLTSSEFGELRSPSFVDLDASSNPDFRSGTLLHVGFVVDMGYAGGLGGPPSRPFTVRQFLVDEFSFEVDSDADGVGDTEDNCTRAANDDQGDADFDGFGNACDADCDQDGWVTGRDFIAMSSGTCDPNGDGVVNQGDLFLMMIRWNRRVGPSALR